MPLKKWNPNWIIHRNRSREDPLKLLSRTKMNNLKIFGQDSNLVLHVVSNFPKKLNFSIVSKNSFRSSDVTIYSFFKLYNKKKTTFLLKFKFMMRISPKSFLMTFSLMKTAWSLKEGFYFIWNLTWKINTQFNKSKNQSTKFGKAMLFSYDKLGLARGWSWR